MDDRLSLAVKVYEASRHKCEELERSRRELLDRQATIEKRVSDLNLVLAKLEAARLTAELDLRAAAAAEPEPPPDGEVPEPAPEPPPDPPPEPPPPDPPPPE